MICKLDGCHFPIAFVLMLDLLYSGLRSRVACLWIGPRSALDRPLRLDVGRFTLSLTKLRYDCEKSYRNLIHFSLRNCRAVLLSAVCPHLGQRAPFMIFALISRLLQGKIP